MQIDLALSMEFLVPVGTSADIALEHSGAFHVGLLFFTDTKYSQTSLSFFRFFRCFSWLFCLFLKLQHKGKSLRGELKDLGFIFHLGH